MAEEEFIPGGIAQDNIKKESFQGKIIPSGEKDPDEREKLKQTILQKIKPDQKTTQEIPTPRAVTSAESNVNARKMLVVQETRKLLREMPNLDDATKETLNNQLNQVIKQLNLGSPDEDLDLSSRLAKTMTTMIDLKRYHDNLVQEGKIEHRLDAKINVEPGTLRAISPEGFVSKPYPIRKIPEKDSEPIEGNVFRSSDDPTIQGKIVDMTNGANGRREAVILNENRKEKKWVPLDALEAYDRKQGWVMVDHKDLEKVA